MQQQTTQTKLLHQQAFVEGVLRHGSGFLYATAKGRGGRSVHASLQRRLIRADLLDDTGSPRIRLAQSIQMAAEDKDCYNYDMIAL
jgi:hypothetical protein